MAAHFSPIMIEGALVLPPGTCGMIEASAAQPLDPVDPQPRIDDSIDLAPHAAGADRMQVGHAALPDFLDQLLVRLTCFAGDHLLGDERS
jgi:hypothetical protein